MAGRIVTEGRDPDTVLGVSRAAMEAATAEALALSKDYQKYLRDKSGPLDFVTDAIKSVGQLVTNPIDKLAAGNVAGALADVGKVAAAWTNPALLLPVVAPPVLKPFAAAYAASGAPMPYAFAPPTGIDAPINLFTGAPGGVFSPAPTQQGASGGNWYDPFVNLGVNVLSGILAPKPATLPPAPAQPLYSLPNLGNYPMPPPIKPAAGATINIGPRPRSTPMASAPGASSWQFSIGGAKGIAASGGGSWTPPSSFGTGGGGALTCNVSPSRQILYGVFQRTGVKLSVREVLHLARYYGFEQVAQWLGLAIQELLFLFFKGQKAHPRHRRGPHLNTIVKACRKADGYKHRLSATLARCGRAVSARRHHRRPPFRIQRRRSRSR